jgi:hypothetical protein
MIDKFEQIEELFKELNSSIYKKIDAFTIGGAVLLKRGMKEATKDIDLVVSTKKEFLEMQNALIKIGFIGKLPGKEYSHMNLNQIFERGDFRIDLFEKEVCGRFSLSDDMKKRAEKVIDLDHVKIHLCSNEDIFLFKTMTEREGDITDCVSIARTQNPDWSIILGELKSQIKHSKQDVWITWVGERFDILKDDEKIDIPIMDDINDLRNKFFDDLEKKQSK